MVVMFVPDETSIVGPTMFPAPDVIPSVFEWIRLPEMKFLKNPVSTLIAGPFEKVTTFWLILLSSHSTRIPPLVELLMWQPVTSAPVPTARTPHWQKLAFKFSITVEPEANAPAPFT